MKSTDFLNEHNAFIAQDADEMHRDQEVQMARADLYNAADYAIKLHKILRGVSDTADMEQWVMEKIAVANENLRAVYEYLNYENKEQEMLPALAMESMDAKLNELLDEGYDMDQVRRDAEASVKANIDKQSDDRIASLRNPKEEPSFLQKVGAKQIGMVKGAIKGAAKGLRGEEFEEGAELKKAKRGYNQAAKDANSDQVGAGKKIDTMKNSLRQKDVAKVKESMSVGGTGASAMATGPVGAAAPMQRRTVKKESSRYANAMKTKKPNLGKGVY
jgi:hypothetical protein